jgi:exopolysaccharide biosynthesis polyprenyl glycosylphosphotransferase
MVRYVIRWVPVERATNNVDFRDWMPFGLLFSVTVLLSLVVTGIYRMQLGRDLLDELPMIVRATLVAVGIVMISTVFLPIQQYSRLLIVYAWILASVYIVIGKMILYAVLSRLHGVGWNTRRVLVVGSTPLSKMVMQNLLTRGRHGYQLLGFVHEEPHGSVNGTERIHFGRFKCLGRVDEVDAVVQAWHVDEVIVALPAAQHAQIAQVCAQCEQAGVAVKLIPDLFELRLSQVRVDHLAGIPLIDVRRGDRSRTARWFKRGIDVVLAGSALLVFSPLFLLTALAIKLDTRGTVFISQQRVGKGGRHFAFFKFRSMRIDADQQRAALLEQQGIVAARIFKDRRDPRRTRVGRIIRQLSIDELPQLFNVLRGDMSLVGPRPPLPQEVAQYEPHHFKRLEVMGGITGMWQVNGRSTIESFEEIILLDTYYIDNWSLALDLKILMRTILAVLARTGAY